MARQFTAVDLDANLLLADVGFQRQVSDPRHPGEHGLDLRAEAIEFNQIFRVYVEEGELDAVTAGRLKHRATSRAELPAVGDWVAVRKRPSEDRGVILAMLPRRSAFTRRAAGEPTGEQVVAANVDIVFIVMGLDGDYNPRRLERYLVLAHDSGARAVVLLNKADIASDLEAALAEISAIAGDRPVHAISARAGEGLEHVLAYLGEGRTGALLGSSGVGKSTIINAVVGEARLATHEVRARDSRGRHTTRHRELIQVPGHGLLIDTPGMRELKPTGEEDVTENFSDIEALAEQCRFRDCRHAKEPGCAVRAAIEAGTLDPNRFANYLKLRDEVAGAADKLASRLQAKAGDKVQNRALYKRIDEKYGRH